MAKIGAKGKNRVLRVMGYMLSADPKRFDYYGAELFTSASAAKNHGWDVLDIQCEGTDHEEPTVAYVARISVSEFSESPQGEKGGSYGIWIADQVQRIERPASAAPVTDHPAAEPAGPPAGPAKGSIEWLRDFAMDFLDHILEASSGSPGDGVEWRIGVGADNQFGCLLIEVAPGSIEMVGGADDGDTAFSPVSYKLDGLTGVYTEITSIVFNAEREKLPRSVWVEGSFEGLEVLAILYDEPFHDAAPRMVFDTARGEFREKNGKTS